jgi:uncharacterized protein DUF3310
VAKEMVNHPDHYNKRGVECIEVVEHLGFNLGNCVKYIWRAGEKGDRREDLRKALWYAKRAYSNSALGRAEDLKEVLCGICLEDITKRVRVEPGELLDRVLQSISLATIAEKVTDVRDDMYLRIVRAIEKELES